jgi:hypothetical protein
MAKLTVRSDGKPPSFQVSIKACVGCKPQEASIRQLLLLIAKELKRGRLNAGKPKSERSSKSKLHNGSEHIQSNMAYGTKNLGWEVVARQG